MSRQLEPWGGDIHLPAWLRRLLHRPPGAADTPERVHERRAPQRPDRTVGQAADRASVGPLSDFYRDGRVERQARKRERKGG